MLGVSRRSAIWGMCVIKLILCLVVVGASTAVGAYLSTRLSERVRTLSSYILMLEKASTRLTYTSDHLASIFQDNFAGHHFCEEQAFAPQFQQMTRKYQEVLTAEDRRLLDDFSRDLGRSDADGELRHIRLYITLLQQQLEKANQDAEQKGRLVRILPLSAGIAVTILMI